MKPLGIDDAERLLKAAIEAGSPAEVLDAHGALVDRLDVHKPSPPMIEGALWYAGACGLRVFPCAAGQKMPRAGTHGVDDATTDVQTITRWWEEDPSGNVAIATGGLVDVIDVDGPEGVLHLVRDVLMCTSCRELGSDAPPDCADCFTLADYGVLGVVSTPRPGGLHLYLPPLTGERNGAALAPHVDLRSTGGYVVAPPSRTEVGGYGWVQLLDVAAVLRGPHA